MQTLEWRSDPPDREGWWVFCFSTTAGGVVACAAHFYTGEQVGASPDHPINKGITAWYGPLPTPPKERL